LYTTGVTRIQSLVLRRIGGRGHFRSRDKDGGLTIPSAMAYNPILYAKFTNVSFTEQELLPIEVLHGGNREFRVFFSKNSGNYCNFSSHPNSDVAVAEAHFSPITDCSILYATGVKRVQSLVLCRIGVRGHFRSRDKDGGHTIRSAMADNSILYAKFTNVSFTEQELLPI